jgi:hypothetical protein
MLAKYQPIERVRARNRFGLTANKSGNLAKFAAIRRALDFICIHFGDERRCRARAIRQSRRGVAATALLSK